jgi:hypothetical protein
MEVIQYERDSFLADFGCPVSEAACRRSLGASPMLILNQQPVAMQQRPLSPNAAGKEHCGP